MLNVLREFIMLGSVVIPVSALVNVSKKRTSYMY